ncbi:MAG: hypothetical protein ACJ73S_02065 [Mycobacteriales bacterium]
MRKKLRTGDLTAGFARADALGAASLGDPESAHLMRSARTQDRPARWRRGAGWAQLDRDLERAVRMAPDEPDDFEEPYDRGSPYGNPARPGASDTIEMDAVQPERPHDGLPERGIARWWRRRPRS